jgi:pSer/pThr/pTyr-binding forkhead associated (FHA) protein
VYKLIVRFEGKVIQELDLNPSLEYMAGRDDSCQIPLKGKSGISRQHFKIFFNGNQWQVDVISKFGHLNYQAQEVSSIALENGNSFSLAPFDFQFIEEKPIVEPSPVMAAEENDTMAIESIEPIQPSVPVEIKNNLPATQSSARHEDFMGDDEKTSVGVAIPTAPMIQISSDRGQNLGGFYLKQGNLWIAGREETCDIQIPDKKASRKHFEISKTQSGFVVTDLGSANGTRVNGRRISPNSSVQLASGDTISVASVNIRFELKNEAVEQQLKNLPDVLFNQTVVAAPQHQAPNLPANYGGGDGNDSYLEPMDYGQSAPASQQLNPRFLLIGALVLFVIYILTSDVKTPHENGDDTQVIKVDDNPLNKLTPEQKQTIKESYASAQSLIQKGSWQLAASELEKIHRLVPFHERSKEMESQCRDALALVAEQQQLDRDNKAAQEMKEYVAKVVDTCKTRFSAATTLNDLNSCLAPAIERDPENSEIVALQQKATQQDEAKMIAANNQKEQDARRRAGEAMIAKADNLQKNQQLSAAVKAYKDYLAANHDQKRTYASEQIKSLERVIVQKVEDYLKQAQDHSGKEDYKGALMAIGLAKKVDPNDGKIKDVEDKVIAAQNKKLLGLYQDAKFEESLGNVQVTKEKCQKIMEMSLPENDYHNKCKLVLKKYGGL